MAQIHTFMLPGPWPMCQPRFCQINLTLEAWHIMKIVSPLESVVQTRAFRVLEIQGEGRFSSIASRRRRFPKALEECDFGIFSVRCNCRSRSNAELGLLSHCSAPLIHSSVTARSLLGGGGRNRTIPALFTGV